MEEAKENLSRVTLFVENIPSRMQWRGLWHMFARHGKVIRTFIAKKLSRGSKRFGFVEFGNEEDSNRAMERLNGFITYGFRLTVKAARQRNSKNSEQKKSPVNEQKRMHIRVEKEEDQQRAEDQKLKEISPRERYRKKVIGHVVEEELWKLQKCLVGVTTTHSEGKSKGQVGEKDFNALVIEGKLSGCEVKIGAESDVAGAEGRIRSLDMGNNLRSWAEVLSGPTPKQPELLLGSNSGLGLLPKRLKWWISQLVGLPAQALSNIEKKRRDRGVRRNKRNKKISEDIQGLELSGRSLSDSDLRIKWERAKLEAKATLELGKKIGMSIRGSEEEAGRSPLLELLKMRCVSCIVRGMGSTVKIRKLLRFGCCGVLGMTGSLTRIEAIKIAFLVFLEVALVGGLFGVDVVSPGDSDLPTYRAFDDVRDMGLLRNMMATNECFCIGDR
ncbi:hypothetical protein GQ457_16G009010 [Hibiscus cannabinus]